MIKSKSLSEIEKRILENAKTQNLKIEKLSLAYLYSLGVPYCFKGYDEHNYKNFLAGFKISNNQYFLLFGKNNFVTDWKWSGYDGTNISDTFISCVEK